MKVRKVQKLAPHLKDKKTFVIYIKSLNEALKHGLKLKKVHRVNRFEQSHWMRPYIILNTKLRIDAKNVSEKDLISVFRETTENIRNHKDMKLVANREKYAKYAMKPNFKDGYPFSKDLLTLEIGKTKIKMNKGVYHGQTLFDLSKTPTCEFYYDLRYDYIEPVYGR